MINASAHRLSRVLHLALGLILVVEGALTLRHAMSEHHDLHLVAVATAQILAALLFTWPRTVRIGGWVLVAMFVISAGDRLLRGDFPAAQLVYVVAVLFMMLHGSRPSADAPRQVAA